METKTFKELYEEAKQKPKQKLPTPAMVFITDIMRITYSQEMTVRNWLNGRVIPDRLTQETIAKFLNVSVDGLFPDNVKKSKQS